MNAPFKTIPGRDASAVIEGFFYQIEQTILHWFGLGDAEVLELESGEDVDVVRNALIEDDVNRVLGQVKLRSAPVSLHSGEILESLVNFVRHRENNPGQKLQLRFITTAKPTMERKRIEGQRNPGLLLWKAISDNRGSARPPAAQLQQIRSLMERGTRPSTVSTEDWNRFIAQWKRNDTEVFDLICAVSWGLSSGAIQQLGHEIEAELVDKLRVAQHGAPDAHIRLVFYVLNRLSIRGEKRLTRTELADELTKIENLSVNPTLLRIVRDTVSHEAQLSRIEQGLKAITLTLANADISPQMRNVQVCPSSSRTNDGRSAPCARCKSTVTEHRTIAESAGAGHLASPTWS